MNVEHPGRIPNEDSAASVNHRSATGWPDFLIRAVAGLAASGPETFIEGLDWSVKADLECMAEIDPGRGPAAPFQTESWLAAWACTQDGKHRTGLRILCGKLGATTLVVIPLCVKRHMGLRVAEMVAQEVSDYNHPLLHPAIREHADDIFMAALWRHAGKMLGDIDCLSLRKLNVRPKWGRGECRDGSEPHGGHWTVFGGEWDVVESSYFGKASRKALSKKQKRLQTYGPVEFRQLDTVAKRTEAVTQLCEWKRAQLAALGMANRFAKRALRDFLLAITVLDQPDRYRIFGIFAGEKPLAYTVLACNETRWLIYQKAYTSEEPGHFSPGLILLRHVMREACRSGVEVLDFGLGDEPYKRKYCEVNIDLYWAEFPFTLKGRLHANLSALATWLRKAVKSDTHMRRVAMAVLRLPGRFGRGRS